MEVDCRAVYAGSADEFLLYRSLSAGAAGARTPSSGIEAETDSLIFAHLVDETIPTTLARAVCYYDWSWRDAHSVLDPFTGSGASTILRILDGQGQQRSLLLYAGGESGSVLQVVAAHASTVGTGSVLQLRECLTSSVGGRILQVEAIAEGRDGHMAEARTAVIAVRYHSHVAILRLNSTPVSHSVGTASSSPLVEREWDLSLRLVQLIMLSAGDRPTCIAWNKFATAEERSTGEPATEASKPLHTRGRSVPGARGRGRGRPRKWTGATRGHPSTHQSTAKRKGRTTATGTADNTRSRIVLAILTQRRQLYHWTPRRPFESYPMVYKVQKLYALPVLVADLSTLFSSNDGAGAAKPPTPEVEVADQQGLLPGLTGVDTVDRAILRRLYGVVNSSASGTTPDDTLLDASLLSNAWCWVAPLPVSAAERSSAIPVLGRKRARSEGPKTISPPLRWVVGDGLRMAIIEVQPSSESFRRSTVPLQASGERATGVCGSSHPVGDNSDAKSAEMESDGSSTSSTSSSSSTDVDAESIENVLFDKTATGQDQGGIDETDDEDTDTMSPNVGEDSARTKVTAQPIPSAVLTSRVADVTVTAFPLFDLRFSPPPLHWAEHHGPDPARIANAERMFAGSTVAAALPVGTLETVSDAFVSSWLCNTVIVLTRSRLILLDSRRPNLVLSEVEHPFAIHPPRVFAALYEDDGRILRVFATASPSMHGSTFEARFVVPQNRTDSIIVRLVCSQLLQWLPPVFPQFANVTGTSILMPFTPDPIHRRIATVIVADSCGGLTAAPLLLSTTSEAKGLGAYGQERALTVAWLKEDSKSSGSGAAPITGSGHLDGSRTLARAIHELWSSSTAICPVAERGLDDEENAYAVESKVASVRSPQWEHTPCAQAQLCCGKMCTPHASPHPSRILAAIASPYGVGGEAWAANMNDGLRGAAEKGGATEGKTGFSVSARVRAAYRDVAALAAISFPPLQREAVEYAAQHCFISKKNPPSSSRGRDVEHEEQDEDAQGDDEDGKGSSDRIEHGSVIPTFGPSRLIVDGIPPRVLVASEDDIMDHIDLNMDKDGEGDWGGSGKRRKQATAPLCCDAASLPVPFLDALFPRNDNTSNLHHRVPVLACTGRSQEIAVAKPLLSRVMLAQHGLRAVSTQHFIQAMLQASLRRQQNVTGAAGDSSSVALLDGSLWENDISMLTGESVAWPVVQACHSASAVFCQLRTGTLCTQSCPKELASGLLMHRSRRLQEGYSTWHSWNTERSTSHRPVSVWKGIRPAAKHGASSTSAEEKDDEHFEDDGADEEGEVEADWLHEGSSGGVLNDVAAQTQADCTSRLAAMGTLSESEDARSAVESCIEVALNTSRVFARLLSTPQTLHELTRAIRAETHNAGVSEQAVATVLDIYVQSGELRVMRLPVTSVGYGAAESAGVGAHAPSQQSHTILHFHARNESGEGSGSELLAEADALAVSQLHVPPMPQGSISQGVLIAPTVPEMTSLSLEEVASLQMAWVSIPSVGSVPMRPDGLGWLWDSVVPSSCIRKTMSGRTSKGQAISTVGLIHVRAVYWSTCRADTGAGCCDGIGTISADRLQARGQGGTTSPLAWSAWYTVGKNVNVATKDNASLLGRFGSILEASAFAQVYSAWPGARLSQRVAELEVRQFGNGKGLRLPEPWAAIAKSMVHRVADVLDSLNLPSGSILSRVETCEDTFPTIDVGDLSIAADTGSAAGSSKGMDEKSHSHEGALAYFIAAPKPLQGTLRAVSSGCTCSPHSMVPCPAPVCMVPHTLVYMRPDGTGPYHNVGEVQTNPHSASASSSRMNVGALSRIGRSDAAEYPVPAEGANPYRIGMAPILGFKQTGKGAAYNKGGDGVKTSAGAGAAQGEESEDDDDGGLDLATLLGASQSQSRPSGRSSASAALATAPVSLSTCPVYGRDIFPATATLYLAGQATSPFLLDPETKAWNRGRASLAVRKAAVDPELAPSPAGAKAGSEPGVGRVWSHPVGRIDDRLRRHLEAAWNDATRLST